MKITTENIAIITGGTLHGIPDLEINELLTDSRQFSYAEGVAFFAIKGINHDGHLFLESLYKKGVKIFVTESLPTSGGISLELCAFVVVSNVIEALQQVAAFRRKQFAGTVIGITGSAGKTVVKEWLSDILGSAGSVIRSPKSYNSQIGVPLSVWRLSDRFDTGVFEAGISLPGEMDRLRKIIDPHVGVITNIGDAHQENFRDLQEKTMEKLRLFINSSSIIFGRDYKLIDEAIRNDPVLSNKRLVDWSFEDEESTLFVRKLLSTSDRSVLRINFENSEYEFTVPFGDRASVENAVTVIAVCLTLGVSCDEIAAGLSSLVSVAMRMEMKNGINGCTLIEDYYNSDPGSLRMAIEYLVSQNNSKTTLILSDFIQSGRDAKDLCMEVAGLIDRLGVGRFIGIGRTLTDNRSYFPAGSRFYYTTEEFISNFQSADFANEAILIKGARIYEFEKISRLLEMQVHQTVLEVNLDAISHNLNEFRRLLKPGTRIMAMVKAFAYGAGHAEIAGLLEFHRIDYLAVAYADEGVDLRLSGVVTPIMVMNPEPAAFDLMIRYNLEPEIYSIGMFNDFTAQLSRHGILQYPVHIKIDSGMHRLGLMPGDLQNLTDLISGNDRIRIVSVFSHLSASEDPDFDGFTRQQVRTFLESSEIIRKVTGYNFMRHILNSSGIIRFPEYQFEMVRPGIGIYGVGSGKKLSLRPAGTFRTRISQVKEIPAGETVGYGCADVSENARTIAILPVGYADGLNRRLGNRKGKLCIKDAIVPIIGNICMDMCMADVTGTGAVAGDEAEIFGKRIPVENVAEQSGTIPYEILTSIPPRVKRIFYRE